MEGVLANYNKQSSPLTVQSTVGSLCLMLDGLHQVLRPLLCFCMGKQNKPKKIVLKYALHTHSRPHPPQALWHKHSTTANIFNNYLHYEQKIAFCRRLSVDLRYLLSFHSSSKSSY